MGLRRIRGILIDCLLQNQASGFLSISICHCHFSRRLRCLILGYTNGLRCRIIIRFPFITFKRSFIHCLGNCVNTFIQISAQPASVIENFIAYRTACDFDIIAVFNGECDGFSLRICKICIFQITVTAECFCDFQSSLCRLALICDCDHT